MHEGHAVSLKLCVLTALFAKSPLLLSEGDLLEGVGGQWVGRGYEGALSAEAKFVSHVAHLYHVAIRV